MAAPSPKKKYRDRLACGTSTNGTYNRFLRRVARGSSSQAVRHIRGLEAGGRDRAEEAVKAAYMCLYSHSYSCTWYTLQKYSSIRCIHTCTCCITSCHISIHCRGRSEGGGAGHRGGPGPGPGRPRTPPGPRESQKTGEPKKGGPTGRGGGRAFAARPSDRCPSCPEILHV